MPFENNKIIRVFVDGGCRGNQTEDNIGGWGVVLEWQGKRKELSGSEKCVTNNIMELRAAIEALKSIKKKDIPVYVYSDSAYVVNGIETYIYNWMSKGWKTTNGDEVKNKDLWIELMLEKIKFFWVKFFQVKGHSDNEGNNRADELVNLAMDKLLKGE